jgi:hypothetical protein
MEDICIRLTAVEHQYNNFQIQQVQRRPCGTQLTNRLPVDTLSELEEMLNFHPQESTASIPPRPQTAKIGSRHQPFH